MANDIASLGLRVDSSEVERGSESLDKLAKSGARAEQATRKFEESTEKAKESVKSEKDEIARLLGQIDPTTKAFERLDQQERKLYQLRASNKLDLDTYTQYKQKIDDGREALARANDTMVRTGNTAKQTAAAMRNVPAQFTDIVVSLQGGQQPLTVLLQQGGQLKDMFGGIGPAARALGSYIAGLVNPFTVAAAAAGVLAFAYKQGSDEASNYTKALIVTGNQSGQTADSMASLAKQVSAVTGTTGAAANALTQIASTGAIAGNQFKSIAIAAVAFESATGQAIEETIAQFQKLAEDPAKASAELNRQYNYLTASVYNQIRALQEQGDIVGAANLAEETYASALQVRSNAIKQNLGYIEAAWDSIKSKAKAAYDAMFDIGREQTIDDKISSLRKDIEAAQNSSAKSYKDQAAGQGAYTPPAQIAAMQTRLRLLQQERDTQKSASEASEKSARAEKESIAGSNELHKRYLAGLDREAKKKLELEKIDIARRQALGGKDVDIGRINREYEVSRKKIEEDFEKSAPKTRKPAAYQDDAAARMLASIRQQEAGLRAQLSTSEKLTGARRELAQFEQQITDLRGKDQLTAEQKSLLANADRIRSELQIKATLEDQIAAREQLNRLTERSAQIQESAARSLQSQQEQYDRQLQGAGLGSQARERVEAQRSIYREYQRYQDQLTKATPKDLLGSEQYKQASRDIQDSLDQAIKANQNYYDQLDQQNQDWRNGASDAFNDYIDNAKNVSAQTRDLFSSAFSGAEDALAKFVTTGKLSFKDLANSIIEDLARIAIRQAATGLFSSALGAATSYFGGGGGAATTFATASSTTTGMTFGGGRASGGSVTPNTFYQVNENGPELLSQGGKTYLMTGAQGGEITPLGSGSQSMTQGSAGSMVKVDIHIASDGTTDVSTNQSGLQQFGSELGTFVEQKYRQLIARSMKPGGEVWSAMNGRA